MLDCSCNTLSHAFYRATAVEFGDHIRSAKSFGNAISILFRATHPEQQSLPGELCNPRPPCQSCTPHIGRAIVEEGLRPQSEFDEWNERRKKVMAKCSDHCTKASACANGFDLTAAC